MSGWVKLHRKLLGSKFGRDMEMVGFFSSLLLMANHKEGFTADGTKIMPGQFMTSQIGLAEHFKTSRAKVQRMLKKLSNAGQIEHLTSFQNTIITIINWQDHQECEQRPSSDRAATEQRVSTNKNAKNNKNNNIALISSAFTPEFFQDVVDTPTIESAENRSASVHHKLAAKGSIVAPESIVLEHFNLANGKNMKHSDPNYKQIRARLKEGFTVDEMKLLIDYAAKVWALDSFWADYNRPSTLFGGKFNEYLDKAQNANKAKIDPLEAFFREQGHEPQRMA
jgi:uncharacterized phage protein (TIGR02220 family)